MPCSRNNDDAGLVLKHCAQNQGGYLQASSISPRLDFGIDDLRRIGRMMLFVMDRLSAICMYFNRR